MLSKMKMALTLTVIGLLSGVSIWAVNELTAPVIADNQARAELAVFFDFFPAGDTVEEIAISEDSLNAEFTVRDSAGEIVGYVLRGVSEGYGGQMTILVGLTPTGDIVDVKVTNHSETPNILTPLLRDTVPALQGQSIGEVTYDAQSGATMSYRAIQSVVNDTRNIFAGDPFLELLSSLEIDADDYSEAAPLINTLRHKDIFKDGTRVASMVDLQIDDDIVSLFYHNDTLIKVAADHLAQDLLDDLNALSGQAAEDLPATNALESAVKEALIDLSQFERIDDQAFVYARKMSDEGPVYYGTSRGFSGQNVFAITLSETGDLLAIETLVIVDTPEYYEDVVVPGIARLIEEGMDDQTAPDAFAEATATGQSVLDIVIEAIAIQGGN